MISADPKATILFKTYFKRDLLTLVEDRVITVRMTLARTLTQSNLTLDRDISQAMTKLGKDHCGDIREVLI
jgi:hypothetical protein